MARRRLRETGVARRFRRVILASPLDLRLSIFVVVVAVLVESSERTTSIEHREYLRWRQILHVTIQPRRQHTS